MGTELDQRREPCLSSAGERMPQPTVLPSQPRPRSLERLDAEIVKAETERGRWALHAESLRARGLDNRAVLGMAQIARGPPGPAEPLAHGAAGGRRRP